MSAKIGPLCSGIRTLLLHSAVPEYRYLIGFDCREARFSIENATPEPALKDGLPESCEMYRKVLKFGRRCALVAVDPCPAVSLRTMSSRVSIGSCSAARRRAAPHGRSGGAALRAALGSKRRFAPL